jgi:putative acetyltransferase
MITIRNEIPADIEAIHTVIERAFAGTDEAILVDRLRESGKATISLVAIEDDRIIGHILFSPVTIESGLPDSIEGVATDSGGTDDRPAGIGLAPLAVLPEFQNRGVGTLLTKAGLEACRTSGFFYAVVLGHPHYYPRFGFVPSVRYHLKSEFAVADDVFMVMELKDGALHNQAGIVQYQPEFNGF